MVETGFRKFIITFTVILAALLELIDTTVVNVSLPQIMGNLGATLEDVGWVVTAYAVANVIILPMSGWLSNRYGRRTYFTPLFYSLWLLLFFAEMLTTSGSLLFSDSFRVLAAADYYLLHRPS